MQGGYDAACVWDPSNKGVEYLKTFEFGSPVEIAQCANVALRNFSRAAFHQAREKHNSYELT
jgi:hypothetical protein